MRKDRVDRACALDRHFDSLKSNWIAISPRDGKVVVIISQLDMETNWAKIDVKIVFASSKFRKPNSNSEDTRHPSLILRQTYEEGYPPILLGLLKRGEQGASTLIERVGREELDGCF